MGAEARSPASDVPRGGADWLLLLTPAVIWGASFLFMALGLRALGPSGVAFVRILVGFVTLGLFPAARAPILRSDRLGVALLGLLWLAFPLSMFPFAEQRISSALTGMLNGANPLLTAIVASALARRPPSRPVVAGLAVGLVGTALVAWPGLQAGPAGLDGVLLTLAGVSSYGFALNLAHPLQARNGALPVIWRAQGAALVLTAPLGLPDLIAARWTLGPFLALLALGALGTGLAYVLLAVATGRFGPTRASTTTFLIPAVALLLGVVVRGERVPLLSVVGGAICLTGALLAQRTRQGVERPACRPGWREAAQACEGHRISATTHARPAL